MFFVAGDKVYAHPTSFVGSIGVISMVWALGNVYEKNKIMQHQFSTSENLIEHRMDPNVRKEIDED